MIQRFKEEQKVLDSYMSVKRNLDMANKTKKRLAEDAEHKREAEEQAKQRKANQMSEWEVNKA